MSRLAFSGWFDLAGERRLELTSVLTVGGIQTTIPIEGTIEDPEVRLEAVAAGSLGALLKKIKELNLIGTSADPEDPDKLEPVIMIDKLPSAGSASFRTYSKNFGRIEKWNCLTHIFTITAKLRRSNISATSWRKRPFRRRAMRACRRNFT